MAAEKNTKIPAEALALYDKLIASSPDIERKGKTVPYTSHNGHMFTHLSGDGVLALRLPKEAREQFIKEYKTELMVSYGVVLKEYVRVPDSLLKNTKALKPYLDISFDYIKTLKPKPAKKSKS